MTFSKEMNTYLAPILLIKLNLITPKIKNYKQVASVDALLSIELETSKLVFNSM